MRRKNETLEEYRIRNAAQQHRIVQRKNSGQLIHYGQMKPFQAGLDLYARRAGLIDPALGRSVKFLFQKT